jgi:cell fate regulator YaaT (PSP1 superfamily)
MRGGRAFEDRKGEKEMLKVVGVKFKNTCKVYYFAPEANETYEKGSIVIVETAKGLEYGTVCLPLKEVADDEIVSPLKPILRKAKPKDLERIQKNEEKREEALKVCREAVRNRNMDMKIIDCDFAFDGTKVVFTFSAPTRVDFRELVKELAGKFHLRIELRQVGIRDETKILGGIAPCGRPCCCSCGVVDFKKVTIKMAKTQGLSLNPGKISGLCGRLMCCLEYENNYYCEACKKTPKVGAEVGSPDGKGVVVSVNMLTMKAKVKFETKEGGLVFKEYPVADLQFKRGAKPEKEDKSDIPPELIGMED